MKSKRKLLISILLIAFVLISIVATVALIFAATQQTITTTLNINYEASDVSATVSATTKIAENAEESMVTANGQATSITFNANNVEDPNGTSLVPASAINLTSDESYVVFKYTFQNNGSNDFVATFNYEDKETADENMVVEYSATNSNYKGTKNAVLVKGNTTQDYYIKIAIENLAKNAEFSGDITWELDSDIVVATSANAQEILDTDLTGKTVVFDAGTYGNLELRPSLETATIYKTAGIDESNSQTRGFGAEIGLASEVASTLNYETTNYVYKRDLTNITFLGTESAIFTGVFDVESSRIHSGRSTSPIVTNYDAVRQKELVAGEWYDAYHSVMNVNGLTFDGLNFTGAMGRIFMYNAGTTATVKNVTVQNCSFATTTKPAELAVTNGNGGSFGASVYVNATGNYIENLKFNNNYSSGYYQGIYTVNVKNAQFNNNIIQNTTHNAIAVQSQDYSSGVNQLPDECLGPRGIIEINNNKIFNIEDRAIRFNFVWGAKIEIQNNEFNNISHDHIAKAEKFLTVEFDVSNNKCDGSSISDVVGATDAFLDNDYIYSWIIAK